MHLRKPKLDPTRRERHSSERMTTPTAFSYHARRSEEQLNVGRQVQREEVSRLARHSRLTGIQRISGFFVLVIIIFILIQILSLSPKPKVVILSNGSDETSSLEQASIVYANAAQKLLGESILNKNKITVNSSSISHHIETSFPGISNVTITVSIFSRQPTIYIQLAQPALVLSGANGSYIVDSAGVAFQTAGVTTAQDLALPTVTDQSNLQTTIGKQTLTLNNVSFIQSAIAYLKARGYIPTTMILPAGASELDMHLSGLPYYIKFNLESNDVRQQAGTFLAVAAHLKTENVVPSQYIDVRVDGRAYYQ